MHRHAENAVRFLARGPEPMCYFLSKQQRLRPYLSGQLYFEKIVATYLAGDRGDDLILRHVQNAMGIDQDSI